MKTMKITANRCIALGTLSVLTLGSAVATSTPAHAISSSTWKKIAIGAGVATGYGLLKGKGRIATIGGIATAGSYYMYKRQEKKENRNNNRRYNYRRR